MKKRLKHKVKITKLTQYIINYSMMFNFKLLRLIPNIEMKNERGTTIN